MPWCSVGGRTALATTSAAFWILSRRESLPIGKNEYTHKDTEHCTEANRCDLCIIKHYTPVPCFPGLYPKPCIPVLREVAEPMPEQKDIVPYLSVHQTCWQYCMKYNDDYRCPFKASSQSFSQQTKQAHVNTAMLWKSDLPILQLRIAIVPF